MSEFGAYIRGLRTARKITQAALADALGRTPKTIQNVEKGRTTPAADEAARWAEALGLDAAERERLIDELHLAHATPRIRGLVGRLRKIARS